MLLGTALSLAASILPPREATCCWLQALVSDSSAECEGFYQPQAQGNAPWCEHRVCSWCWAGDVLGCFAS